MAFSKGKNSVCLSDILSKVTEAEILSYYLGIIEIPIVINSPLREDKNPSFGLYYSKENKIHYVDFSTGDRGGTFDLLEKLWACNYNKILERINKDISKISNKNITINSKTNSTLYTVRNTNTYSKDANLQCKIREWKDYDIEYWSSYGINLKWLKYAEVYPISHKIIIKNNQRYTFKADKYAYAYVEHKEGKVTLKIYQPFNNNGYKWSNKHDSSVISLWTKVPEYGDKICICSSLKDALCLWANTGIPSIAVQGEGYNISKTAINELKRRFHTIFVLFDNDEAGIKNGLKFSESTGFINVVLPYFNEGKDISDLMKAKGKEEFLKIISPLLFLESEDYK